MPQSAAAADLEGRDVDDLHAGVRSEDAQHRQLSADGLAGAGRRAQQHALICVVQRVEGLRSSSSVTSPIS